MARPNKNNIGSFPFDVDFFDDRIMVRINGEFGAKGIIIVVKLLCAVYRQGYFLRWSIDEQYLMKRYLSGISVELIDQVLKRLLKWGFFNNDLFKSDNILTSVEIQRNYFNAIKRRASLRNTSFPFLLLNPERPNDVSAYKNEVNVCNNGVSVSNNEENVAENEVYVINNPDFCKNKGFYGADRDGINVPKKEFLHTETGVSAYKNPDNGNRNSKNGDKNHISAYKNPLDEHFAAKRELSHAETGVSVDKNSGLCMQKLKEGENNNCDIDDSNGVSANNNGVSVSNNEGIVCNNSDSVDKNPPIYNNIYNHHQHQQHHHQHKESEVQNDDFGEQKGKEGLQELESDLQNLLKEEIWKDVFCKNHKIDKDTLPELIQQFKIHCISQGKIDHIDYNDTKSHFGNWLRINTKPLKNISYGTNGKGSQVQRRRTDITSERKENYHSSF